MKKTLRTILAMLLLAATVFSAFPAAFAKSRYASGQFYCADWGTTDVYTIQFSAGRNLGGAEKNRDSMLDYGNDAFVYSKDDYYYIMTGKFRSYSDAKSYLNSVKNIKGAEDGYITTVCLPEDAVNDFESVYFCSSRTFSPPYNPRRNSPRWSTWIPDGFECYEDDNCWCFYNDRYDMSVVISQEEICATSQKSRDAILSDAYYSEEACHSFIIDCCLDDSTFDMTGYDGSNVFYVRGIITKEMFYRISFDYPKVNRRYCDAALEDICACFYTF